ncbi:hypothetical protein ABZ511_11425 [Nocardia gamkensis]|uniref:hypothetical protein n=1 Tax=Nocardia gamkensis TaxID=352869 RepID=UPI0033F73C05
MSQVGEQLLTLSAGLRTGLGQFGSHAVGAGKLFVGFGAALGYLLGGLRADTLEFRVRVCGLGLELGDLRRGFGRFGVQDDSFRLSTA